MKKITQLHHTLVRLYRNFTWPHLDSPARFLRDISTNHSLDLAPAPLRIFCFWTGENPMSSQRRECLSSIQKKSGVEVILITPKNLNQWILQDHPLPEEFDCLSLVHKSDYLRSYFMYHFGGGYTDIKQCLHSWLPAFTELNNSRKIGLGYTEINKKSVACLHENTEYSIRDIFNFNEKIKSNFKLLIGNCAYIFKPQNPVFYHLLKEQNLRLKEYSEQLKHHPGNAFGSNAGYPIPWTALLGDIFHPIVYMLEAEIIHNNIIRPSFVNYR